MYKRQIQTRGQSLSLTVIEIYAYVQRYRIAGTNHSKLPISQQSQTDLSEDFKVCNQCHPTLQQHLYIHGTSMRNSTTDSIGNALFRALKTIAAVITKLHTSFLKDQNIRMASVI